MIRVLLLVLMMLAGSASPALAERLASTLSNISIQISSSFSGEVLTMFGNVEPDAGSTDLFAQGPFNIVIVVEGPHNDRVARRKTNVFGIWVNTEQVRFRNFPSFYHVLSSGKLETITDPATLTGQNIDFLAQAQHSVEAGFWDSAVFGAALVRLMTEQGYFGLHEDGVRFLSDTAYAARLVLPHDIANGRFVARTYVFRDRQIVAQRSEGFTVQKIGFERFLFSAASQQPILYGLACVLLAVFTGWLGGVVFRR
jgi:uncharacterized protein (TIGR02186 family)